MKDLRTLTTNDDDGQEFCPFEEAKLSLAKFEETGATGHLEAARNCLNILLEG